MPECLTVEAFFFSLAIKDILHRHLVYGWEGPHEFVVPLSKRCIARRPSPHFGARFTLAALQLGLFGVQAGENHMRGGLLHLLLFLAMNTHPGPWHSVEPFFIDIF